MKRLTYRPKTPFVSATSGKTIKAFCDAEDVRKIIHRLADYEDKAERIEELLKADEEGRLIVLPCKTGETVIDVTDPEFPKSLKDIQPGIIYKYANNDSNFTCYMKYDMFTNLIKCGRIIPLNEDTKKR